MTETKRQEIIRNWRGLLIFLLIATPAGYFLIDTEYIPEDLLIYAGYFRGGVFGLSIILSVVHYFRAELSLHFWRIGLYSLAIAHYLFFTWEDHVAVDSQAASYYMGFILVTIGVMLFRIHTMNWVLLASGIVIYAVVNWNRPVVSDAIVDLATLSFLFYMMANNYNRVMVQLENTLRQQRSIVGRINHDWKMALQSISHAARRLGKNSTGTDKSVADMIELQTQFMYNQACELVEDGSENGKRMSTKGRARLREVYDLASRTAEFVREDGRVDGPRPPDITVAVSDQALFRIFLNLFVNGISYSTDQRIKIHWENDEDTVTFFISNSTRRPISEEELFVKYASQEPGGTGLGLWNTRLLILDAGGDIQSTTTGTDIMFELTLPLFSEQAT